MLANSTYAGWDFGLRGIGSGPSSLCIAVGVADGLHERTGCMPPVRLDRTGQVNLAGGAANQAPQSTATAMPTASGLS